MVAALPKRQRRDRFAAGLVDQVGGALHVVMDSLAPAECVAFVLHDGFGYPFDQISALLGRSGTATRKLASRARTKVQDAAVTDEEKTACGDRGEGRLRLPCHRRPRR